MDWLIWLLVGLFFGAFGSLGVGSETATVEPAPQPDDPIAQQFADREPYRSCGEVSYGFEDDWDSVDRTGWRCLADALAAGNGAEYVIVAHHIDQNPITEYHRVTPAGRYEYYSDNTQNSMRDEDWSSAECAPGDGFVGHRLPGPLCTNP